MDEVKIDRITADLEKKFTGDAEHDVKVVQDYCRTLPPCEESAKLIAALSRYASEKYPDASVFKVSKIIDNAIAELEKSFNGDADHDVKVIQDYCRSLPKTEDNFKVVMALGQYAAVKFPEAAEVKKSKAEFDRMNEEAGKLKKRIEDIQETIKGGDMDKAIEALRALIDEAKLPDDQDKRFVSFSHPLEEVLFRSTNKDTREVVRVSNLMEMLNLQLSGLLAESGKFDEAEEALDRVLFFNPVSAHAHLERARFALLQKNYDDAFERLQEAYPYIFTRQLLAIFYCMLAVVVENVDKNYELAAAYAHISLVCIDNPLAHETLDRICKAHNVDPECPSAEKIRKLATDANLPYGPSAELCELAINAARQMKSVYPDIAKQLFATVYELTGQEALLKEIR
ncbi:MAG: tetratricopeptide repeat protein [Proteobacteria bacterium]|nr:tetratricopeptide repeat protein [Pseudomonadota bacterium]